MAEFSDAPLEVPQEHTIHGFFPGRYVTEYLEEYLDAHIFGEKTLRDRVLLRHRVISVEKNAGKWEVVCESSEQIFRAKKLIIASGLTSKPNMPMLPNRTSFSGAILHQKDFGQSSLLTDPQVMNVVVLGGGKSAADMVYACAKAGKSVSWVVRKCGCGAAGHARAAGPGPYKNSVSSFSTRFSSSFSPSIFAPWSTWSWLLHRTRAGMKLVDWIWANADKQNRLSAGYSTRQGSGIGFKELEPDTPYVPLLLLIALVYQSSTNFGKLRFFWQNEGSGIDQRPDFWEVVAEKVDVFRSDIAELSEKSVKLRNGSSVAADAIICATGWDSSLTYLSPSESARLGLPVPFENVEPEDSASWKTLETAAQIEVLKRFPRLAQPPNHFHRKVETTPYRLYKAMAPLNDRTIVILGHIQVGNNFMAAECQALWTAAYFDGRLRVPSKTEMAHEIALVNAWCRLRYLDKGQLGIYYYFDLVPYVDMLLDHIRVGSHLRSWPQNKFWPVTAKDLRNLYHEYLQAQGGSGSSQQS